jgi:lysophospholipase L1-like esterase
MSKSLGLPLALVSLLVLATSVAHATPRMPTHVACVGDSITQGVGASSGNTNYPANLQKLVGDSVKVGNFGHSGATMLSQGYGDAPYQNDSEYTAATSFVTNAGAGAVVDVIIMLGANDSSSRNWTPDGKPKNDQQYLKDYRAMVEHFKGLSPQPVVYIVFPLATGQNCSCGALCCQISGTVIHDEQIPLIKQLAQEQHVPIIDLNTPTTGHPEYFADGIHPNDAGYVVVAQTMKDGLDRVPTISLTSPVAGAALDTSAPIALSADASGGSVAIDSVEFFQGATSLGKSTMSPFTLMWPAPAGIYMVTAKAIDSTLASATSESVAIEVKAPSGGSGGGAGAAGAGGAAGTAGAPSVGNSGGVSTVGGVGGAGTGSLATTPQPAEPSGCSCRAAGGQPGANWRSVAVVAAFALAFATRFARAARPCR